jgi:hypothetical protein
LDGFFMATPEMSLERFYLIVGDLRDARKFADYILTRHLHDKRTPTWQLIHQAFNLAMVVSYCRPFMRNLEGPDRDAREIADSPLWFDAWSRFDRQRFALHKEILRQRNNIFAHSPTGERFPRPPMKGQLAFHAVLEPLNREDTRMLRSMIKTWLEYLEPLKSKFS